MNWFRKKRIYVITYKVHNVYDYNDSIRTFIVKASDIAEATKLCQKREKHPISVIECEVAGDNGWAGVK